MKNTTSKKLNIFKTSPLIGVVAILEIIILICVSTFAWFVFAQNNNANSGNISVEPDSGLEIDFSDANENDYINIWNYLNDFSFEPVTSIDGRNLFIPTTGTFSSYVRDNTDSPSSPENPGDTQTKFIVYFDTHGSPWTSAYIECDYTANIGNRHYLMTKVEGTESTYYVDLTELAVANNFKSLTFLKFHRYDHQDCDPNSSVQLESKDGIILESGYEYKFALNSDGDAYVGSNGHGRGMMLETNPQKYTGTVPDIGGDDSGNSGSGDGTGAVADKGGIKFREATVNDMNSKYINIDFTLTNTNEEEMPVYLSSKTYFDLYDPNTDESIPSKAIRIAFYQNDGSSGNVLSSLIESDSSDTNTTTVYFRNTLGWEAPCAYVWNSKISEPNWPANSEWPGIKMTPISGDLYYCTFGSEYDSIVFNSGSNSDQSVDIVVNDGYIYSLGNKDNDNKYTYSCVDYISDVKDGTYPVISPGASTGFQRPYAPITEIDNYSGAPQVVIPAFASSIDDYSYGSTPLFNIKKGETLSLSMIIWLEGTDPDCTEDVYAGKTIDMNLVFATNDSDEATYIYNFLDKTKENWIDDKIVTATGVSFEPVMQLYDVNARKGYLMNVKNDAEGKPTIWTCEATQDLINAEQIMFRRVNPMNEDEVWNYWDTKGFKDRKGAVDGSNVYFTAFSDSAPTKTLIDDITKYNREALEKSCGGLWGKHETRILTVYDGTDGQWIKNTDPVKEGYSGALTIRYTYDGQDIEYKASGSSQSLYYIVVPECIVDNDDVNIVFSRYFNYNTKHGFNSPNNDLVFHRSWKAEKYGGDFYEISHTYGGNDNCYWGDDIHYIQVGHFVQNTDNDEFSTKFDSDTNHMQVRYATDDNEHFYSYIFKNASFKGGQMLGYASVIPSDKEYTSYRVERCQLNSPETMYNATDSFLINSTQKGRYFSNTVEQNGIKLIHFKYTLYYKKTVDEANPKLYQFLSGNDNEKTTVDMQYDSSKMLYYADWNISLYNSFEFHENIPKTTTTAYLIPTARWNVGDAIFQLKNVSTDESKDAEEILSTGIYKVESVPNGNKVEWCRMNPNGTYEWNSSGEFTFTSSNPICRITNWSNSFSTADTFESKSWEKDRDGGENFSYNGAQYTFDSVVSDFSSRIGLKLNGAVSGVEKIATIKTEHFNVANDYWG